MPKAGFQKSYRADKNALVYTGSEATPEFWDERWTGRRKKYASKVPKRALVPAQTQRFLQPGATVLEGGCGLAHNSWYLHLLGYKAIALDFAPETVDFIRAELPELEAMVGDVRDLPLEDASVDGYWSLGVIEHFWQGYDDILAEMQRVIRPGGFAFVTFPYMNPLRRAKAKAGLFPVQTAHEPEDFYQFALDPSEVVERMRGFEFECRDQVSCLGVAGLAEEVGAAGPILEKVLSGSRPQQLARAAISRVLAPVTGHSVLLVLQRR